MIQGTPSQGPLSPREEPGSHLASCPSPPEQRGVCPGAWGGGTGKAAWTLLLPWGGERCHESAAPPLPRDPGYGPAYFAPSWRSHRGRQPGFGLAAAGLSTCAHHKCSVRPRLSLRKQTLTPAKPLCSQQPCHPHQTQLA